jgi:D-aminoacyl-tRNA deacylase
LGFELSENRYSKPCGRSNPKPKTQNPKPKTQNPKPKQSFMRSVIQRVSSANVTIDGSIVGQIGPGLLILLGVAPADTENDAQWLAEKICTLRIFANEAGPMNHSVRDIAGGLLVVSQFTLFASTRKGTRPSWDGAAKPDVAIPLYESFVRAASAALGRPVATGRFGAMMSISLVNDGPLTIIIDSRERAD